jgi:hypothetical protein
MRALLFLLVAGGMAHATMNSGDVILVNLTQSGNLAGGNWNEEAQAGNTSLGGQGIANLKRLSDGAFTGVSLSWNFTSNNFDVGIGGYDNPSAPSFSFPESGTTPAVVARNLAYNNPGASWVFSGLSDALTYKISIMDSHVGGTNVDNYSWDINGVPLTIDGDGSDGSGIGEVITLTGIATDGSGNIIMTSSASGTQHINALELVAVGTPQPGSLQFTSSSYAGPYDGGSITVNVERVGGTAGTVSVDFATENDTAFAGTDYTVTTGTLTWNDTVGGIQSFSIPLLNNPGSAGTSFTVNLSGATGGALLGSSDSATVNIAAPVGEGFGTNLAAYLNLDETAQPVDHSQYRLGATVEGTVSTGTSIYGNARSFDGSGDRIVVDPWTDEIGLPDREALTVSLWFKADATSGQHVLFDDPAKHDALGARISDGNLQVTCLRNGKKVTVSSSFSDTTSWHNLAVVKNGDSLEAFLDGSPITPVTNLDTAPASAIDAGTGSPFFGTIDEVRLYRRALSSAEIAELQSALPLGPSEIWRGYYFAQTSNTGSAADGIDYDGDGSVNLLERAFATNPTDPVNWYAPVLSIESGGYLALTYRRLAGGSGTAGVDYSVDGLTYTVEYDTALTDPWSSGSVVRVGSPVSFNSFAEEVTVRLPTALSPGGRQFVRLKVTTP